MELSRLIAGTNTIEDMKHEIRQEHRNAHGQPFRSRWTRKFKMKRSHTMANAALERARALKEKKGGLSAPKTTSAKKASPAAKKSTAGRTVSKDIPWLKIKNLYDAGKSTKEIADTLGLTRPKTKDGKENPYPYYLVVGYLTKLSHGVEVDGKKISITRGNRSKK